MRKKKYSILIITLGFILIVCLPTISGQTNDQRIIECKVSTRPLVKYKLVSIGRGIGKAPLLGLRIVVRDKYFNKNHMLLLVRQINEKYCYDNEIGVTIFDDEKIAKIARIVVEHLAGERVVPEIRGFYSYSRLTGKEQLEFSTKRGNPTSEMTFDLSKESQ